MRFSSTIICLLFSISLLSQKGSSLSFRQWISLQNISSVAISPDGENIVYGLTTTDWEANRYDTEFWMLKKDSAAFQLTFTPKGSSSVARFTPDGKQVCFIADRGSKRQLYIVALSGGEPTQVTFDKDGISTYQWSPDGTMIAYLKADGITEEEKRMQEEFGSFAVKGAAPAYSHVWLQNYVAGEQPVATKITSGDFTVGRIVWSPDSRQLALNCQPNSLAGTEIHSWVSVLDIASGKLVRVINKPYVAMFQAWSPDGTSFVYSTNGDDSLSQFFANKKYFIYDSHTRTEREILIQPDENKNIVNWNEEGMYFTALNKMSWDLYRFNPATGKSVKLAMPVKNIGGLAFARKANTLAFTGAGYDDLPEVYRREAGGNFTKLTNSTGQLANANVPVNETIQWKSKDGQLIEGILTKPSTMIAGKKYPLLVVIHGGPDAQDIPEPVGNRVYPTNQWVEKGALVLRVNYRGSTGYGEKFRRLNVRNWGTGDMWDVLSGIDYLDKRGIIDTARMGCMGWSMGGYISAFLLTNTHRFKAISVGAGISNWTHYYSSTDITSFTLQYLKATPWKDKAIYDKASPMTTIQKAQTPTLIQHGELDERVPPASAYELYRGLLDNNVPAKLIIYKGFGHALNKPKERLHGTWENWNWFNHYLFGEEPEKMLTYKE